MLGCLANPIESNSVCRNSGHTRHVARKKTNNGCSRGNKDLTLRGKEKKTRKENDGP